MPSSARASSALGLMMAPFDSHSFGKTAHAYLRTDIEGSTLIKEGSSSGTHLS